MGYNAAQNKGVKMKYPSFFDSLESITLYDPLSHTLGAFEDGLMSFTYLDVVKSAGHSCPTIAGAYLMVREGLKALYPSEIPERGNIVVSFKSAQQEGTTGVVANVFSLITGASDVRGFKGMGGQFVRTDRLFFDADISLHVKMQRLDTHQSVEVAYEPAKLAGDSRLQPLLAQLLTKRLNESEKAWFAQLWQRRVQEILENFDKVIDLNFE
jgi:hypothetical protein